MEVEQETMGMLVGGFTGVTGLAGMLVVRWWVVRKDAAYAWFLAHLVTLAGAVATWLTLIPSRSEDNSLRLGEAGMVWAVSMVFLLIGLGKKK